MSALVWDSSTSSFKEADTTKVYSGGGSFVNSDGYVYQNGAWVNVFKKPRIYIFNNGDQCTDITGGWLAYNYAKVTSNYISLYKLRSSGVQSGMYTKNYILYDNTYKMYVKGYNNPSNVYTGGSIEQSNYYLNGGGDTYRRVSIPSGNFTIEVPLYTNPVLSSDATVSIYMFSQGEAVESLDLRIYEIWFEKN